MRQHDKAKAASTHHTTISIRMTAEERRILESGAASAQRRLSDYLRWVALGHARANVPITADSTSKIKS